MKTILGKYYRSEMCYSTGRWAPSPIAGRAGTAQIATCLQVSALLPAGSWSHRFGLVSSVNRSSIFVQLTERLMRTHEQRQVLGNFYIKHSDLSQDKCVEVLHLLWFLQALLEDFTKLLEGLSRQACLSCVTSENWPPYLKSQFTALANGVQIAKLMWPSGFHGAAYANSNSNG